jgi:hypothetical protein
LHPWFWWWRHFPYNYNFQFDQNWYNFHERSKLS